MLKKIKIFFRKFRKINFKKVSLSLSIGIIVSFSSFFCFNCGTRLAFENSNEKISYSIDTLSKEFNADYVNYSISKSEEDNKETSRSYFKNKYNLESGTIMLSQPYYTFSSFPFNKIEFENSGSRFLCNSALSIADLTFCFNFPCKITNASSKYKRVGVAHSTACKLLGHNADYKLSNEDLLFLQNNHYKIYVDKEEIDVCIYAIYDKSSFNSYFSSYLYGDFIVFHETEMTFNDTKFVLTAVPHRSFTKQLLDVFGNNFENFQISLTTKNSQEIILNKKIDADVSVLTKNSTIIVLFCCFATLYLASLVLFIKIRKKISLICLLLPIFFFEIFKTAIFLLSSFFLLKWIIIPWFYYLGLFPFIILTLVDFYWRRRNECVN